MTFRWLKPYMPRSLYGRAILILLLPVVTLLLVVSVIFIQRHFEGVTRQMTQAVSREVQVMAQSGMTVDEAATSDMARVLEITVEQIPENDVPKQDFRRWYDVTAIVVTREFNRLLPDVAAISLPDDYVVKLYFVRDGEAFELSFDRRRVSPSNPHQLLVNMLVFSILVTIVSYFYLRNQLRPITRLSRAAEAFGRGHNVPYRAAGAIEVRAAGNAFLNMRARIERQIEQRTMMLSGVSHDLRTPITRLKLGLSMLEAEDSELLQRDVLEMERLIEEFLAFARGAQEGVPEAVDPTEFLSEIVEDSARAGDKVKFVSHAGEGQVMLRKNAIRRAVSNLIGNAVRYGNHAEVSMKLTERMLRIRVEDDGPGIPADSREQAMKPFARLDVARNQDLGSGVGLGLAIAADIAHAHGGTLRLGESDALGGLRADIIIAR
ncbi:Osmolarity sensor protein EnvZ [Roseovarius albus]|uniref:histidine kinase n=1 Tax=Roseovarius albus TaxID=1247867 RepID=A0A1X6YYW5_9RHOB|nr:ATP-binding protein [Roseovarius albus]SLN34865.1 Osmolarity sensor protein EnvZ [Roseovarius albus]